MPLRLPAKGPFCQKTTASAQTPAQQQSPESRHCVDEAGVPELSDLVRYQNPETGQTWCGFGRPPNWIRGKDRARYRVR